MAFFNFNSIEIILLSLLGSFFLIQLLFYCILYNRIHRHNIAVKKGKIEFSQELPPVSVIICATNQSENLKQFLPLVLEQDYPKFEVIVVNDSLSDESEDVLKLMENKYPNLYHTFTPDGSRYLSRKKLAVTVGIKASKYEWLVFTEANCYPTSRNWLRLMARNFTENTGIVLGYSGYEQGKGWLNIKCRFDNLFCSMRYLSSALTGRPYMGSGRNMAYKKEYFFRNKGFSSHLNLQRGEDDLFINEIATPNNIRVETDKESIVRMKPLEYSKEWRENKLNYITTSSYFKGMQRQIMGIETLTRVLFYLLLVGCIITSIYNYQWALLGVSALLLVIRYLVQAIVFNKTSSDLEEGRYFFRLPLFDIIQPAYSLGFRVRNIFRGKREYMRK